MKPLLTATAFLVGIAASAQTAYELAPSLQALAKAKPQAHQTLADGTFDTYGIEERLLFAERLLAIGGDPDPASVERWMRIRERAAPEARAAFDRMLHTIAIDKIRAADRQVEMMERNGIAIERLEQQMRQPVAEEQQ